MKLRDNMHYVSTILLRFILISLIVSTLLFDYCRQGIYAYAALTEKYFAPVTVGNREANLSIKVFTSNRTSLPVIQLRLYDTNNNQTIKHVTYNITLTQVTSLAGLQTKAILRDIFHAHNGILTLNVHPVSGGAREVTVNCERDPFQNAWVAHPDGVINLRGPILLNSGLYHFHVEIFGIDNDRNLFIPDHAPKFDSIVPVQIGNTYNNSNSFLPTLHAR